MAAHAEGSRLTCLGQCAAALCPALVPCLPNGIDGPCLLNPFYQAGLRPDRDDAEGSSLQASLAAAAASHKGVGSSQELHQGLTQAHILRALYAVPTPSAERSWHCLAVSERCTSRRPMDIVCSKHFCQLQLSANGAVCPCYRPDFSSKPLPTSRSWGARSEIHDLLYSCCCTRRFCST